MWNNPQAAGSVTPAVGKGCLAGFGLAGLFLVIGGVAYLILGAFGLALRTRLLVAILSGPVIGTFLTLLVAYLRAAGKSKTIPSPVEDDEPAAWD
jgi:hypothetical protein